MNVSAIRSVLADRCERDASFRAVFDFHRRTFATEICFQPGCAAFTLIFVSLSS